MRATARPAASPPVTDDAGVRASRVATLLSTTSDEAATSLLPGLLSITLGASPIALGVVEGLAGAADGIARLAGGPLSEDPRRRRWISAASHPVMGVLIALIATAGSSVQVGVLRAGASAAQGLRSPQRYAAVPDRVGSSDYGRAFGFERGMHHLAAVGGPLLAFAALALLDVRAAMLVAVLPCLVAAVIGFRLLRSRPAAATARTAPRLRVREVYAGRLGRLMTGITMFELANFAAVLLVLRATTLLGRHDVPFGAAAMAVLLYLLWRLAAAPAAWWCGRAVDRIGPVPVLAAGVFALLVSYAGFAFVSGTIAELAVCFAVAGAASGAIEAAEHVGVAQMAPVELRWSAFGVLSAVRSFGRLTASVGAAVVWTVLGAPWGLLLAAPFMLGAVVVMTRGLLPSVPVPRAVRAVAIVLAVALAPAALVVLLLAAGLLRFYT